MTFMPMMSFLAVLTCPISCGSSSFLIFSSPSACPALLMFLMLDCPSNSMVGRAIWIHQPEECFLSSHCQEADYSLFKEERRDQRVAILFSLLPFLGQRACGLEDEASSTSCLHLHFCHTSRGLPQSCRDKHLPVVLVSVGNSQQGIKSSTLLISISDSKSPESKATSKSQTRRWLEIALLT